MDQILMPATQIPSFRTKMAIDRRVEKNLLFTTWGGIGDQICTEPTLRFAIDNFGSSCRVSLWTEFPELFSHLAFDEVYIGADKPNLEDYFVFQTIVSPENLVWEFASHCITHCVDFPAICSLRCTLPIEYKAVRCPITLIDHSTARGLLGYCTRNHVVIHAGRHWQSKTFPAWWWNSIIFALRDEGYQVVLIGKDVDENIGTVDVDASGCADLRNLCTLSETIYLLQNSHYLVCSDSSPLHMAATGRAHIAFVATAKHQDFIYHWRKNAEGKVEWAWRMQHFNRGGMWDVVDQCPNKSHNVTVDLVDQETLVGWLPEPDEILQYVKTARHTL